MFDNYPMQYGLKQGAAIWPLLLNFALEYAIKKIQENQVRLKLNWAYQLLAYADYLNVLEDNTDTVNKNIEIVIDDNEEVDLKVNSHKTKHIFLSCHQGASQNH
jgi:hypothetical protein